MPSATEAPATQQQYLTQVAITAALTAAIQQLTKVAPDPASPAFKAGLMAIVTQFGQASAAVARNYYQQIRTASGINKPLTIKPVGSPPATLINAAVNYGLNADATGTHQAYVDAAYARIMAASQKAVTDMAREQTMQAVAGDQYAIGFRRVPRPDACAWCIVMATRTSTRTRTRNLAETGSAKFIHDPNAEHFGVFKSRTSAGELPKGSDQINGFHNNCHCVVEPVFFHGAPSKFLVDMKSLYDRSGGLNGFRRALDAQRAGREPSAPIAPVTPLPSASPSPQIAALLGRLSDAMSSGAA